MPVLFGAQGRYVCGGFGLLSNSSRVYCWICVRIAVFAGRVDWVVSLMSDRMLLSISSVWRCEACL